MIDNNLKEEVLKLHKGGFTYREIRKKVSNSISLDSIKRIVNVAKETGLIEAGEYVSKSGQLISPELRQYYRDQGVMIEDIYNKSLQWLYDNFDELSNNQKLVVVKMMSDIKTKFQPDIVEIKGKLTVEDLRELTDEELKQKAMEM